METLARDQARTAWGPRSGPRLVVPVRELDRASLRAIAYARSISAHFTVLALGDDLSAMRLRGRARSLGITEYAEIVTIAAEPSDHSRGIAAFVNELGAEDPARTIAVVLGDAVPRHAWLYPLHDPFPLRLKRELLTRPNTVVIDVPYHV